MSKIKLFSRLVVLLLAAAHAVAVNAEYHVVQSGDVLSVIAEKKRVQSGFLLSTEQIMLTLYQLNKNAFVNGNINQLVITAKILIPDNTADYIQLSKTEAQQRLHDKSYLRSLISSANTLSSSKHVETTSSSQNPPQNIAQIIQTLESHQQNIDALKNENARLTNKFNLLDKALGRVVLVQGLLTNDVVQVKSKVLGTPAVTVTADTVEKAGLNDTAVAPALDSTPPVESQAGVGAEVFDAQPEIDAAVVNPEVSAVENKNVPAESSSELLATEAATAARPTRKVMPETNDDNWLAIALIALGTLMAAITGWWFFNFHTARSKKVSIQLHPDVDIPIVGSKAKAFESTHFDVSTALKDTTIIPVKTIIERSQKAVKESENEHELSSVLELLDMCLLCGDYQQAHAVTVKALAEHKTSAVLAKKLSFIERKMAKL